MTIASTSAFYSLRFTSTFPCYRSLHLPLSAPSHSLSPPTTLSLSPVSPPPPFFHCLFHYPPPPLSLSLSLVFTLSISFHRFHNLSSSPFSRRSQSPSHSFSISLYLVSLFKYKIQTLFRFYNFFATLFICPSVSQFCRRCVCEPPHLISCLFCPIRIHFHCLLPSPSPFLSPSLSLGMYVISPLLRNRGFER